MKNLFLATLLFTATVAQAGQTTPVPDVAPDAQGQYVVINIPQKRLFLYNNGRLQKVYPVGVGKAISQTNLGEHRIGAKAFNPTWHIPRSIQRERGDGVKTIPPGPRNPLGPVFVRLGDPKLGLGIHGTSNPSSVPGVVSHGCVRMKSPDALEFARTIHSGTQAIVSYEMAALNQDSAGNLWLAVFKDPYNKRNLRSQKLKQTIEAWANANNRTVSMVKVDQILRARAEKPVCLTCGTGGNHRIKGDLVSIAWNSGSYQPTAPKGAMMSINPSMPKEDEILPEGTEIEVDAADIEEFKGTSVFDTGATTPEMPLKPVEQPAPKASVADDFSLLPQK